MSTAPDQFDPGWDIGPERPTQPPEPPDDPTQRILAEIDEDMGETYWWKKRCATETEVGVTARLILTAAAQGDSWLIDERVEEVRRLELERRLREEG